MATTIPSQPVKDTVPRVNNEVAVGEDLQFQRRWWRFENCVWILFALLILLDLLGFFGRGYMAKKQDRTADGTVDVKYERIERFSSPSILTIQFGNSAIKDGKVQLWMSESLIETLGNQRVVPQPEASVIGNDGILYTFAASATPASIAFQLEPTKAGMSHLRLGVPGSQQLDLGIFVMP